MNIVIYFRCGFMIEPLFILTRCVPENEQIDYFTWLSTTYHFRIKKREWGKWGMSGEKIHKKNGDSVPDNFHFPQETVLFHPEFRISLLLQIHSQPYKRAWLPQKKAQKLEKWNRYSPQNRSFLEDTFLFQVIRKIDDYVNNLIMSLLEEKKAFPFQLFQLFFQHIPPTPIFIYIYIYYIYN